MSNSVQTGYKQIQEKRYSQEVVKYEYKVSFQSTFHQGPGRKSL